MSEQQGAAGAETFTPRANVAVLAFAMVLEAACLGVASYMLFAADGHWAWWFLFGLGLLMGPGAFLKYLSAARCRGDAGQITGYMVKGFGSLSWSDVKAVQLQASRLIVTGESGKVVVNLAYLRNREELKAYVKGRCEAHGLQPPP